jgi:ferredoxin
MIEVVIDRGDCTSCSACWERCPDFFEQNPDDEFSQIVEKYRTNGLGEGEAPDDLAECIIASSDGCPVQIIHVS